MSECVTTRAMVEDALRCSSDVPQLADCEIGRLLGVSGCMVGQCRRRLEVRGEIPAVDYRLGRRGFVDVRQIGKRHERSH